MRKQLLNRSNAVFSRGACALGQARADQAGRLHRGAIEVQDEGSQLLALAAGRQARRNGGGLLRRCRGKTLAIGATMRTRAACMRLMCRPPARCPQTRLARSGLSNIHPPPLPTSATSASSALAARSTACWSMPPCSGLGTLRRNPDLKWRQSPQAVQELVVKQAAILDSAARLQTGRASGLCHLQHLAAGKRGHCRRRLPQPTRFRAAGCQ